MANTNPAPENVEPVRDPSIAAFEGEQGPLATRNDIRAGVHGVTNLAEGEYRAAGLRSAARNVLNRVASVAKKDPNDPEISAIQKQGNERRYDQEADGPAEGIPCCGMKEFP